MLRVKRAVVISAILALGAAGSVLAGSAVPAAATGHAHVEHAVAGFYYHGGQTA